MCKKDLLKPLSLLSLFCCLFNLQLNAQVYLQLEASLANESARLSLNGSSYTVHLDENGAGTIQIDASAQPGYATLYEPRGVRSFYIYPNGKLKIRRENFGAFQFSGTGKEVNDYLNSDFLKQLNLGYSQSESDFIRVWKKLPSQLKRNLDAQKLPKEFKQVETKRLHYMMCNTLLIYPLHHSRVTNTVGYIPSEAFFDALKPVMKEDPLASHLWEYRSSFKYWIEAIANKPIMNGSPIQTLTSGLNFIAQNIEDNVLAEYLTDAMVSDYLRFYGSDNMEDIIPLYKHKVKNKDLLLAFDSLYEEYSRLTKGQKAPSFSLKDTHEKEVSLSSFLGKYVYIDVWATWCGPCCKEFPALAALADSFKDKNIEFVGLSIDKDKNAWIEKVKSENLHGVQLHIGDNISFQKDYKISLIPRFILIDPKGNIVDAKMSRPSNDQTAIFLRNLEGI